MTDPYAIRERTHRSDGIGYCRRCNRRYPCKKAGTVDEPVRYRWAILLGALAAVAVLCVVFGGWMSGAW